MQSWPLSRATGRDARAKRKPDRIGCFGRRLSFPTRLACFANVGARDKTEQHNDDGLHPYRMAPSNCPHQDTKSENL